MSLSVGLWPEAVVTVAKTFGARGAALRVRHELWRWRGLYRTGPTGAPGDADPIVPAFIPRGVVSQPKDAHSRAMNRAARVRDGCYDVFRWKPSELPASGEAWRTSPLTGSTGTLSPWWTVSHLSLGGDIKLIWEPARFGWAYDLIRGWLLTRDEAYPGAFFAHLRRFVDGNPPFLGAQWSCGQEVAIRAIALLYAEGAFADAEAAGLKERELLRSVLWASGQRIADAIGYARSQRNNHALSEAVGILALGTRFARSSAEARQWAERGSALLEELIEEQFEEDGWYIQHSFNYLRLALDLCVIAQRVLQGTERSLSLRARERLAAAVNLLSAVIDPDTGIVPNYGANDGAFVHPITTASYRDFRPVLTAACATFGLKYPEWLPLDEESLVWLGVGRPATGGAIGDGLVSGDSGWAAVRHGAVRCFLRAGRYRSRPGQIDPLQLDVRIGGRELVVDAGSYSYNAPAPWRNGLAGAVAHNGPIVDGEEPGIRGPRFLWYIWPSARIVATETTASGYAVTAELPGRVTRHLDVRSDRVVVRDRVTKASAGRVEVNWLLAPNADPNCISVQGGAEVRDAVEGDIRGWFSPHYGQRIPSRYVHVKREAPEPLEIITEIRT